MSQSILIAGQGKTGTTGLYNAVKEALRATGQRFNGQFEPTRPDPLLALGRYDPYTPILTKVMSERLDAVQVRYQDFDVRLMTVRDPRDVVISRLLFFPLIRGTALRADTSATDRFVQALREKEADPDRHSVVGLYELAGELGIRRGSWEELVAHLDRVTEQIDRHDFHVVSYEDFVDGRLDELSDHLGMPVTNPAATGSAWLGHIPRSMAHGEWRTWFTQDDADFFADLFADFMARHGYDPGTRPLADAQVDPATGSQYVEGKLARRREQMSSRYTGASDDAAPVGADDLALLVGMAEDGDAVAGHRAAVAIAETPDAGRADHPSALDLARGAARRGHEDAMRLAARLLRDRHRADPGDRDALLEARFWEREADLGPLPLAVTSGGGAGRLERVRAERDALRASTRYRLGSLLADLAVAPWPQRRRAARDLVRLARRAVRTRH